MWNTPTEKQLAKIPALYETENIKVEDKKIYMHFFIGGCDWWAAEYSPEERIFFGYACLGNPECAEWGYFSLDELIDVKKGYVQVDRDLHWNVKKVKDIPNLFKLIKPVKEQKPPEWYINSYYCPDCDEEWNDEWDCSCDDECPICGKKYTPVKSTLTEHR